jgi:type IV pilus assembly protein PilM
MFTLTSNPKPKTTVGLDIEASSIAATEIRGTNGSSAVERTAIASLPPGVISDGEIRDGEAFSESLKALFADHKLGKSVRLGIANQGVVVRTIRLPRIEDEKELETAIRFQAQDQIPMPLENAVLDYQAVRKQAAVDGETGHMDVLAVAARRDMVNSLVAALNDAGLEPVGIDLAAFGMIRALADRNAPIETTTLYCYLGDITNLAVAAGDACLFTRIAPFGIESIAAKISERTDLPTEQARELLLDVGLAEPVESFGGPPNPVGLAEPDNGADLPDERLDRPNDLDVPSEHTAIVREELEVGASKLVDELRVTLDYYGAQEGASPIDRVVICGPGRTIDGLAERIQVGHGLAVESGAPGALAHLNDEEAARLTLSYGLALEE